MLRRFLALLLILCLCCGGCAETEPGRIYLYGESHGMPAILDLELELWQKHYHEDGMRHLFVEFSYFTAQFLNLWMRAEDDAILLQLYDNWEGTTIQIQPTLDFFRTIKQTCPETVFHGTDVGHQYWNTGEQYLTYLEEHSKADSEEYRRATESIEQGKRYYCNGPGSGVRDDVYRENTMAENFIREYEALDGESVMGIYGTAHVRMDSLNHTGECDSMAKQLAALYPERITSEDLSQQARSEALLLRTEMLNINRKAYEAEYFGAIPLSESYHDYVQVEFWRLTDAYEKFSRAGFTGTIMGESYYPMALEEGTAYVLAYSYADGRTVRKYYLCDGTQLNGVLVAREVYSGKIK